MKDIMARFDTSKEFEKCFRHVRNPFFRGVVCLESPCRAGLAR